MGEKRVEPGRWVMTLGALFMSVSFGLGLTSAFMPWWRDESVAGGDSQETEVTLWVIKTVTTLQAKEVEHFGCDGPCDQTRNIANKITTKEQTWDDTCRRAKSNMLDTCTKINVIRTMLGIAVLGGFFYVLPACLSFTGSENPGHLRFSPVVGIVLAAVVFLCLAGTMITAVSINGMVPYAGDEGEDRSQRLAGEGFIFFLTAWAFCLPALLLGVASQVVTAQYEVQPFELELEDRPALANWKSAFSGAPSTMPPTVQTNAWEENP